MIRTNRVLDCVIAALLLALALWQSPIGLFLTKGASGLGARAIVMTLALDAFLLAWIAAILAQGRLRGFFLRLMVAASPLLLFDGLEELARSVHLSERLLPTYDGSVLLNNGPVQDYFLDETRQLPADPGWRLYRPRKGDDGIFINELGLRTASPTPKSSGEWRVAISGASTVFGTHVLDADTIPADLQQLLRYAGRKITVYNFGIEGATLEAELLTLQRFREIYALDQVLFYTGGNDVLKAYLGATKDAGETDFRKSQITASFELAKAAKGAIALAQGVNSRPLAKFEDR